uniref:Decapping nuclease n=1 Tax=Parastrongyloides trichosuri TaxID=131310 RepID=A0A0N4ZH86_PARTI
MLFKHNNIELINKPKEIGRFSIDKNGELLPDGDQNKRFLYKKFLNQNLFQLNINSNLISYEERTREMELNTRRSILKALKKSGRSLKEELYGSDFYCSSGILTKFATSSIGNVYVDVWCKMIDGVIVMVDSDTFEWAEKEKKIKEEKIFNEDNILSSDEDSDKEEVKKEKIFNMDNILSSDEDSDKEEVKKEKKIEKEKIFNVGKILSSDEDSGKEEVQRERRSFAGFASLLKFQLFFQKDSKTSQCCIEEGVKAWKQYRRVYFTDINDLEGNHSIRVTYNSIIHCVDEADDRPVLMRTIPAFINEDEFEWSPEIASRLYMQSFFTNSRKIIIGEKDRNGIIHISNLKSIKECLKKPKIDTQILHKNLQLIFKNIKEAFEVRKDGSQTNYVRLYKPSKSTGFNVTCFSFPPDNELSIKVFDDI